MTEKSSAVSIKPRNSYRNNPNRLVQADDRCAKRIPPERSWTTISESVRGRCEHASRRDDQTPHHYRWMPIELSSARQIELCKRAHNSCLFYKDWSSADAELLKAAQCSALLRASTEGARQRIANIALITPDLATAHHFMSTRTNAGGKGVRTKPV